MAFENVLVTVVVADASRLAETDTCADAITELSDTDALLPSVAFTSLPEEMDSSIVPGPGPSLNGPPPGNPM